MFALPSLLEALPTVAVEALASGTPVVSADHPGGVELHELFGDDVLVVPKAECGSLATALTDALADPRRVRPDTLRIVSERFRRRPIEAAYAAICRARAGAKIMMAAAIRRRCSAPIAGGLLGPLALVAAVSMRPQLGLEMDRDVASVARGFYESERAGDLTFAWTRNEAVVRLPGLDRRRPWSCTIRLRSGRPDPATLPDILVSVDGVTVVRRQAGNDWEDVQATLPPRPEQPGAVIALTSSNTFQPGSGDTRALGVMVDSWVCRPESSGLVMPPRNALTAAAVSAAVFGGALGLAGLSAMPLFALLAVVIAGQGVALGWDFASFSPYVARLTWTAVWIAAGLVGIARGLDWIRRVPLTTAARAVIAISAVVLYVKLAALLHPSKLVIDAVFQAHRLEWVLSGRYFFTQTMPSGVQFPYAIALYVFAAPWSLLTRDHVALLRIVVLTMEVTAGALLYPMIVRSWGDRVAGVIAVALFSVVPVSVLGLERREPAECVRAIDRTHGDRGGDDLGSFRRARTVSAWDCWLSRRWRCSRM